VNGVVGKMISDIQDVKELNLHMERMKIQLYKLVEQKGSFLAPEVIKLSQEIDTLVVVMQRSLSKQKQP
jgi:hypothetical protein